LYNEDLDLFKFDEFLMIFLLMEFLNYLDKKGC